MPLNHRYFGRKTLTGFTKQNLIDGLYSHLTSATYADGTSRSSGPSNWSWTQNEAKDTIIGTPAVNTIGHRVIIAITGATQPAGVIFRNGFTANSIVVGLAKNTGASPTFSTWDDSDGNPFSSGSFSGYTTILQDTTSDWALDNCSWLAWESQQTVWIQLFFKKTNINETQMKLIFAGQGIDPQTGDSVDEEANNGGVYTIYATGANDNISSLSSNILGSLSQDNGNLGFTSQILFSTNNNGAGRWYSFIPGTGNLLVCARLLAVPSWSNALMMTTRTGKYPRIPVYVSNTDLSSPGTPSGWAGKLREVFYTKDSTSGQVLVDGATIVGYTVSNAFAGSFGASGGDTLLLKY